MAAWAQRVRWERAAAWGQLSVLAAVPAVPFSKGFSSCALPALVALVFAGGV